MVVHEYGIAQALVEQVSQVARDNGASGVTRVVIQVGRLRSVVPDALRWGFEVASAGSVAEGAELVIEEIPISIRCKGCGTQSDLDDPVYICPECKGLDVEPLSGDELILKTLEIGDERDTRSSKHPARE